MSSRPAPGSTPVVAAWVPTACGIFSAFAYALANVCLRAVTHVDPCIVSQIKAMPTMCAMLPFLVLRMARGQEVFPSLSFAAVLIVVALMGQVGGNVGFQWSLGIIGMGLSVPINLGMMIVGGAAVGYATLGDRLGKRMIMASLVLLVAVCLLSLGATRASTLETSSETLPIGVRVAGVIVTCLAGIAYGILSVTLRYGANRGATISSLLGTVGTVGSISLAILGLVRVGPQGWTDLQPHDWCYLLGAGVLNVIAFAALTRALQLSSVTFVNLLSASQSALAAMSGVVLFHEPFTWWMVAGVAMTAIGLMIMKDEPAPTEATPASGDGTS